MDTAVLLCEDNHEVQEVIQAMLESLGHQVTPTDTAKTCIDTLGETPDRFDIILLDQMLPDMLGDEAIYQLRAIVSEIPILRISGRLSAIRQGSPTMTGQLGKPFTITQLDIAIRSLLDVDD